jgi:hypothetical protein
MDVNNLVKKETLDFAKSFWDEKENLLNRYFSGNETLCGVLISELTLSDDKKKLLYKAMDTALKDAFYTVLLALDGEACLGNAMQQQFKIITEDGIVLSESGELELAAGVYFNEDSDAAE